MKLQTEDGSLVFEKRGVNGGVGHFLNGRPMCSDAFDKLVAALGDRLKETDPDAELAGRVVRGGMIWTLSPDGNEVRDNAAASVSVSGKDGPDHAREAVRIAFAHVRREERDKAAAERERVAKVKAELLDMLRPCGAVNSNLMAKVVERL